MSTIHRGFVSGAQFFTVIVMVVQAILPSGAFAQTANADARNNRTELPLNGFVQPEFHPTVYDRPTSRIFSSYEATSSILDSSTLPASAVAKLTCDSAVAGVTCTDYGTYLDFDINIVVTGLTGGATAGGIVIGHYRRDTNGGYMGMSANFQHCETSGWTGNTVYSRVYIHPFDAGAVGYAEFSSLAGTNVCVTNNVPNDWRYVGGSGGWPNTLSVGGNVDWPLTGFSLVGHIYLYTDPNFIVPEQSILSSSVGDACLAYSGSNGIVGGPINTHSGGYDYTQNDISFSTSAGILGFTREYASLGVSSPTQLSPGWTHNHDTRLIFPSDPEGLTNFVLFKAHTANKYLFSINGDGTYTAYPGLCATFASTQNGYTLKDRGQRTYSFDTFGRLLTYSDSEGNEWNYTYLANGNLSRVEGDGGASYLSLSYDTQGRIYQVADHTGRHVEYHYNSNGDLSSVEDVTTQTWTYEYHPSLGHYLTRVAAPGDVTVERTDFYQDGRAWKQFDGEDNLIVELLYNENNTVTIVDALGGETTHTYDARNTLVAVLSSDGGEQEKIYDNNFRPKKINDANSNETLLEWSSNGINLTKITDAQLNETEIFYDSLNNPTSIIDPLNYETKYFYEDSNFPTLPTKIEYPLSFDGGTTFVSTTYQYYAPNNAEGQPAGKLKLITDALGHQTFYTYTSIGQVETATIANGTPIARTSSNEYDNRGNLIKKIDAAGVNTCLEYDAANRLTKETLNCDPLHPQNFLNKYNIVTEYRYDIRGNQIAVIAQDGVITRTYFDAANRSVSVVQNLTGQGIEVESPPTRNGSANTNLRTDMFYDDSGNAIAATDPTGVITRTYYDSANRPATVVVNLVGQDISVATPPVRGSTDQNVRTDTIYDLNGNMIATIDPRGVITRTYYDEVNRPATIVQNLTSQSISISTPPEGRGTNGANIRTDFIYDANGNTIATINPADIITRTYYDATNRPISEVQNLVGQSISNSNPPVRISGATDQNIRTDTYYDQAGNAIASVDPRGIVTRTYYDEANHPVTVIRNLVGQDIYVNIPPAAGNANENIRTDVTYDLSGRKDTSTDPIGQVTKYSYNELGQVMEVTDNYLQGQGQNYQDKFNFITAYGYDLAGRQVSNTDTLDRETLNTYDQVGHLVSVTQNNLPGQGLNYQNQYNIVTSYTYDAAGDLLTLTDPNGQVTSHATASDYDALHRPTTVTDPNGYPTNTSYDVNGNTISVTDALEKTTYFEYNNLNQQTKVTDSLGNETRFLYSSSGLVTVVTNADGIVTRYEYDDLGRLNAVTDNFQAGIPADAQTNVRTEYTYDSNGNRLTIKDGNNHITTFEYDPLNRLGRETDPLGNSWQYGYDAAGNRVMMSDANEQTTQYIYDEAGRLSDINYPGNDIDVSFVYDAVGRRTHMTDGLGTTTWVYDQLNRAVAITDPSFSEISYGYDAIGNRTSLTYPDGRVVGYIYDFGNRLTTVSSNQSSIAGYQYDEANRLKFITRPNNVDTAYSYDNAGNILSIIHALNSVELIASYEYTYDGVGNRTQVIEDVKQPTLLALASMPVGTPAYTSTPTDTLLPTATDTSIPTSGTPIGKLNQPGQSANVLISLPLSTKANSSGSYLIQPQLEETPTPPVAFTPPIETHTPTSTAKTTAATTQLGLNPLVLAFDNLFDPFADLSFVQPASAPHASFSNPNVSYITAPDSNLSPDGAQQVDFGPLPLAFIENLGQFKKEVKFQTNSLGGSIYFTPSEVVLALMETKKPKDQEADSSATISSKVVRIEYKGAAKDPVIEGLDLLPGVANFVLGSDKNSWTTGAPTYTGIVYHDLYPGIDLQFEGVGQSLKSTFLVDAGADPTLVDWRYKGAKEVSLDPEGNLRIQLPAKKAGETETTLIEHTPLAWQEQYGQRVNVPIRYELAESGKITFSFPEGYDTSLPLVIDPVLSYNTYLGGLGTDVGAGITTDANGNVYVTGYSYCGHFPEVDPIDPNAAHVGRDVIISKLNASGSSLLYSTCIGGAGDDSGNSIALDSQGRIVVGGETDSTDFPIVSGISTYGGNTGLCTTNAPCQDSFILALNSNGSAIRYSTYLGGDGREMLGGIALNANDDVVVVGSTISTNFPTVNAYDNSYATGGTCTSAIPCYDVTVTRIDPDLSGTNAIQYSTYLGGITRDLGLALTLDANGIVYLTGYTDSSAYPTRNALQSTMKGTKDIIVTQIDTALGGDASLLYSTYFGTSAYEAGHAIARDGNGNLYLTGVTSSPKFPLRAPVQHTPHAGTCGGSACDEAFVTKLDISTNTILYSTYLGGSWNDQGNGIAVDPSGRMYVTGFTTSTDFPIASPIQGTKAADECSVAPCMDAFLSVLEPDGQAFAYSTYLGGGQDDEANGIALDSARNVYLVGETYSTNFPTTSGAYDEINTQSDKRDAFIAKFGALDPYVASSIHLNIPVPTSSDDAEEKASGNVSLTSSDLELVYDGSLQTVGLRFTDLNIPPGAIIQNAWIQFLVDTANSEATSLSIQTQASDNPPTFAATSNNISSRPKTTASVSWAPPAWSILDEAGPDQRTPNLASVMQEVVDRPGWTSGNAMVFLITGTGQRLAKSYDGELYGAPYLHVEYTLPEPTPTPTPTLTDTPTPTFAPTTTPTPSGPVTIIYDYDPLYRLTSADHSSGEYYHYAYDAVGNRLMQEKSIIGLVTSGVYTYDDANRLATFNGVTYTWDNNGNLLNDGVNAYTYDSANRLKQLVQGANTYTFGYNGMGDRLSQNGVQYTLDLNAGLTQVLKDGTNTYLYGLERIVQVNDTATEYFLGDALGSVRQLTDAQGSITLTQSYTPYGDVMASAGDSASSFAFTGEQLDSYIKLIYLRSRMYDPSTGRFTTRDSWRGDYSRPTSLNRWSFVEGNPINHSDPSGHSIGCTSLVFSYGTIPSGISASQLISMCREFYTPHYWANNHVFNCNKLDSSVWSKPQTVGELFEDYICERGPERIEFNAGDNLTKQLEYSILLDRVRREFYKGGVNYPKELKFNPLEFLMALNDVYAANIIHSPDFPLTHFLGSFNYTVTSTNSGRIKITIDNRTDLASGTHFPGAFPPEGEGAFPLSLEKVVREGPPELAHMQAWDVIRNYRDLEGRRIVSVLAPLTRSQTFGGMGGGTMSEVFTWTEANLSCKIQKLPWPFYLPLLNIQ